MSKAKWEKINWKYYCSNCKHEAYSDSEWEEQFFEYCPFCGKAIEIDPNDEYQVIQKKSLIEYVNGKAIKVKE